MTTYTSGIVKQWACDTIFVKNKPAKDIQTAFQSCALAKAFTILTTGKLMKREEKWRQLSEKAQEQTLNFMTFNFSGVQNIPAWCTDAFVAKKDLKADCGPWVLNVNSESAWKRAQEDVRIMRNELSPLWIKFLSQHSAGKGGVLGKVPSGTALVELLDKWLRLLYACDLKRRENLKDRKVVLLEEIEVLGGSSFKACSTEIDDNNVDEIFPGEVNEENRPSMSDVSVEADSDSECANCPLNESLSSCSSLDTEVKAVKDLPSGWFFTVIIIWTLLGPLSEEPLQYTDIAGSFKLEKIAAGNPTTLAGIREAAANVGANAMKEDQPLRSKAKLSAQEYQSELKNKLIEKAVAASQAASEEIRSMTAQVTIGVSIKKKKEQISFLRMKRDEESDENEKQEFRKKLKKAEEEYEELLA